MTRYDDHETSCPMCSRGIEPADLCEHDDGPLCPRCCGGYHRDDVRPLPWKAAQ